VCHELQLRVLDFLALSLGLVSALRPAATQLQAQRPPQGLCTVKTAVLVLESILVFAASEAIVLHVMTKQPWFTGGTGQNIEVNGINSLLLAFCLHQAHIYLAFWRMLMHAIENVMYIHLGVLELVYSVLLQSSHNRGVQSLQWNYCNQFQSCLILTAHELCCKRQLLLEA